MASALESVLPQSYMIFGKKKDHNPLEEFWMNKIESIESQYDKHIIKLERTLLDNKANKRRLIRKDGEITNLKSSLEDKTNKVEKLSKEKTKLQNELSLKSYKVCFKAFKKKTFMLNFHTHSFIIVDGTTL